MCGIGGFFWGDQDEHQQLARRMQEAMRHRGPDSNGTWTDTDVGLSFVHTRLAIIDLSPDGHQPMHSASQRFVITFNGEIYNFAELRRELLTKGAAFRGAGDTEVMLAGFEVWGVETKLQRLSGMFAFALWDRQEHELWLVRDRLGEKPLSKGYTSYR